MAQNDLLTCTAIQTHEGTRFTNIFYLLQTSADPTGEDQGKAAADALFAEYFTPLAQALSDQWSLLCIEVTKTLVTGLLPWRINYTLSGVKTTASLPTLCTALLALNIDTGAKGKTGRVYVSGATVTDEFENNLTNEMRNQLFPVATVLTEEIENQTAGTTYFCGPKQSSNQNWKKWEVADVRQPYTRLRSRRASTKC